MGKKGISKFIKSRQGRMKRRCGAKNWLGMVLAKFIRPFGTLMYFPKLFPKNKFLGYYHLSLWDIRKWLMDFIPIKMK